MFEVGCRKHSYSSCCLPVFGALLRGKLKTADCGSAFAALRRDKLPLPRTNCRLRSAKHLLRCVIFNKVSDSKISRIDSFYYHLPLANLHLFCYTNPSCRSAFAALGETSCGLRIRLRCASARQAADSGLPTAYSLLPPNTHNKSRTFRSSRRSGGACPRRISTGFCESFSTFWAG